MRMAQRGSVTWGRELFALSPWPSAREEATKQENREVAKRRRKEATKRPRREEDPAREQTTRRRSPRLSGFVFVSCFGAQSCLSGKLVPHLRRCRVAAVDEF